jgi:hypothetical protein
MGSDIPRHGMDKDNNSWSVAVTCKLDAHTETSIRTK